MKLNKLYKASAAGLIAAFGAVTMVNAQLPTSDNSGVPESQRTAEFQVSYVIEKLAEMEVTRGAAAEGGFKTIAAPVTVTGPDDLGNLGRVIVTSGYDQWDVILTTKNGGRLVNTKTTTTPVNDDCSDPMAGCIPQPPIVSTSYATLSKSTCTLCDGTDDVDVPIAIPLYVGLMQGNYTSGNAWHASYAQVTDANLQTSKGTNLADGVSFAGLLSTTTATTSANAIAGSSFHGRAWTDIATDGFAPTGSNKATFILNTGLAPLDISALTVNNDPGDYEEEFRFTLIADY